MQKNSKCPLCSFYAEKNILGSPNGVKDTNPKVRFSCQNCGTFIITTSVMGSLLEQHKNIRHVISGYVYEKSQANGFVEISSDTIASILSNPIIPRSPVDKFDRLILWYYDRCNHFGEMLNSSHNCAICYAKNEEELRMLHDVMQEKKYICADRNMSVYCSDARFFITYEGFRYAKEIMMRKTDSDVAFVGMWFSSSMVKAYDEAIKPAIEILKFLPLRIDKEQHNNDITDEIIAGIQRSRFMISDMTGYRGGVYYEAGYARGLGIPVIYCCRRDWFDGELSSEGVVIKEKVHFDVNHLNFIIWDNEAELYKKLLARISATIV